MWFLRIVGSHEKKLGVVTVSTRSATDQGDQGMLEEALLTIEAIFEEDNILDPELRKHGRLYRHTCFNLGNIA